MSNGWGDDYRKDVSAIYGQKWWTAKKIFGLIFVCMILGLGLTLMGNAFGWCSEAATVVRKEFGPKEMLRKYIWLKDAAAQLDKKKADIQVYQTRIDTMRSDYEGEKKKDWPRDERENFNKWLTEIAGVKASYNSLAGEYNSRMAQVHWSFAEVGKLPQGATEPLPREFKPYVTE